MALFMMIVLPCIDYVYKIVINTCDKIDDNTVDDNNIDSNGTQVIEHIVHPSSNERYPSSNERYSSSNERYVVQLPIISPTVSTNQTTVQPNALIESNITTVDIDPPPVYEEPPKYDECIEK